MGPKAPLMSSAGAWYIMTRRSHAYIYTHTYLYIYLYIYIYIYQLNTRPTGGLSSQLLRRAYMGPAAPLSFGASGPKTYSYLSLEMEENQSLSSSDLQKIAALSQFISYSAWSLSDIQNKAPHNTLKEFAQNINFRVEKNALHRLHIIVAFCHSKIWWPLSANNLSMNY